MKTKKTPTKKTAKESLAAAFHKVAARYEQEWENGEHPWAVDVGDLVEIFRAVADEIDPSGSNSTR